MNPEAQEFLNNILKKNPSDLTREERAFLRARVSYLKDSHVEEYATVLNSREEPIEPNPEVVAKEAPFAKKEVVKRPKKRRRVSKK